MSAAFASYVCIYVNVHTQYIHTHKSVFVYLLVNQNMYKYMYTVFTV